MSKIGIRYLESFDDTSTLSQIFDNVGGAVIQTSGGRTGNNCMLGNAAVTTAKFIPGISPGTVEALSFFTFGVAVNFQGTNPNNNGVLVSFQDNAGNIQVDLRFNGSNQIFFTRNGTQIGPTSSLTVANNGYSDFEFKVTIGSGTSGSAEVKVNGVVYISVSGVNTQTGTAGTVSKVVFGSPSGTTLFDDIYIADDDYHGDLRNVAIYGTSAGTFSEWTPNAAGANYTKVNEHPPDDNTTYNSAGNVSERDSYKFTVTAFTGSVAAIMARIRIEKDDAGPQQCEFLYVNNGAISKTSDPVNPVLNTYGDFTFMFNSDPATGLPFTQSDINTGVCEFGVLHNFSQAVSQDNMNNWTEGTPTVTTGATISINIH